LRNLRIRRLAADEHPRQADRRWRPFHRGSSWQRKPKIAAAGPIFWWIVNSLAIGEQRLLNQRSLPGQASMPG
jgi:hypothetical protein